MIRRGTADKGFRGKHPASGQLQFQLAPNYCTITVFLFMLKSQLQSHLSLDNCNHSRIALMSYDKKGHC